MRLFTGIGIPYKVRRNLELLLAHLKPTASIRWSRIENLHNTTKFIGEWPEDQLDDVKSALRAIPHPSPFSISITGLGWFPNPHSPRVFWCGIQAEPLAELAVGAQAALARIGIAKENRPYSPHLTLARIESPGDLFPLKKAVAALPSDDFGRFTAEQFSLYLSKLGPGGSVYTILESYPLGNE
jgi:2'-5' RNA ligase